MTDRRLTRFMGCSNLWDARAAEGSPLGRYPVPRSLASLDSRQHVALPPLVVDLVLYHWLSFAALPIVERFNRSDEPLHWRRCMIKHVLPKPQPSMLSREDRSTSP